MSSINLNDQCTECGFFRNFRDICLKISQTSRHKEKSKILTILFNHIEKCHRSSREEKLNLWLKLLLPKSHELVFNLKDSLLIKIFASLLGDSEQTLKTSLEKFGDISLVIANAFKNSNAIKPHRESSNFTLTEIDCLLKRLCDEVNYQNKCLIIHHFLSNATVDDSMIFVRLIKRDLRINAGQKVVITAINEKAYDCFKRCPQLNSFVRNYLTKSYINLIICPILPMLAKPCKNFARAFESFRNILAEVKYDGERVQVHKVGNEYAYFSRNLKPLSSHKVENLSDQIARSFNADIGDLVLDGEIVLYDNHTHQPLPFGTLGVNEMKKYKNASIHLILFDILKFNGVDVMRMTLAERRKILEDNVIVRNNSCIELSKCEIIRNCDQLSTFFFETSVNEKLEGIMLKNLDGYYEPGLRHWLKIKKDYVNMVDTVDLVVLGAYFGSGKNGGKLSVFLMGCLDTDTKSWKTVCKVANCSDTETIDNLQAKLREIMLPINRNKELTPQWLEIHKSIVPDYIVSDAKLSPVWEIIGAGFSKSSVHTAAMISIRFPRVVRFRNDKSWKDATCLRELISISDIDG